MTTVDRPLLITLLFTAKTYDIDFAGVVHNLVYIRWLEDLRLELLAQHLPIETMLARGVGPILTRTEIDYRWPVRIGERPLGQMWVGRLGRVKWVVHGQIILADQLVITATQTGFFADMTALKPVPIPAELRQKWHSK
jgi:acyl-CoA thioester hydrolase